LGREQGLSSRLKAVLPCGLRQKAAQQSFSAAC